MKTKLATSATLLALMTLGAGSAMAQSENDRGFYVGGGLGQFNVELDTLDGVGDALEGFDNDDTAWQLFAGWRFNRHIALEAAYLDFGAPTDRFDADGSSGDYTFSLSGFSPSLVLSYPLGPVELFARGGYYFYDVEIQADFDDPIEEGFSADSSESDFIYGAGIGATFFDRLNIRAEYNVIDLDEVDNANALWLSASWRF